MKIYFKENIKKKLWKGLFLVSPIIGFITGKVYESNLTFDDFIAFTLLIGVPTYMASLGVLKLGINHLRKLKSA